MPSHKIYEDDEAVAFLNIKPIKPGHTLVVSKQHFNTFLDTSDEILAMLFPKVKKVAKAIVAGLGDEGCNISVNVGRAAGQVIFHTHVHIIPRGNSDGLIDWPHREYKSGEAEEIAEKIKLAIKHASY